jgi:hypothetical protein
MSDQQSYNHLPAFDLFLKLFEKSFNCSIDGKTAIFDPKQIEENHLSLLLAWPGILTIKLSSLTNHKKHEEQLKTVTNLLKSDNEYQAIHDVFETLIEVNPIPEGLFDKINVAKNDSDFEKLRELNKQMHALLPETLQTIILLFNPGFKIHSEFDTYFSHFIYSLGNYFIIFCIIAKFVSGKNEEAYVTIDNIQKVLRKCNLKDQIDLFNLSLIWIDLMEASAGKVLNIMINKNKKHALPPQHSYPIPSTQLHLNKFAGEEKPAVAFIDPHDSIIDEHGDIGTVGFALDINVFKDLDYHLWHIGVRNEKVSENEPIVGSYLFDENKSDGNNLLEILMNRLYQTAKKSSLMAAAIMYLWNEFVDDPAEIVQQNSDEFNRALISLIENYETRKELFNYKDLLRSILSIDKDINNEEFDKSRKKIITSYRKHISPELEKILLEANNEIYDILDEVKKMSKKEKIKLATISRTKIKTVQKTHTINQLKAMAKNYWESKDFKHIQLKDLEFLGYTSDSNKRRDGCANVLARVAKRHGKPRR